MEDWISIGFVDNLILFRAMKKFWKSIKIWQSYGHEYVAYFFLAHPVYCLLLTCVSQPRTWWWWWRCSHLIPLSSELTHVSSSFPASSLSPSITPSLFFLLSKLIFSTNLFLHRSSTFPPTGLTPRTLAVFRFSRACLLTLALCARLS